MNRTIVRLSAAVLLAAPASAAVHVVDDDGGAGVGFTDLPAAVAAAADGDLILVKTGTYSGFTIADKALVITADLGQAVSVTGAVIVQNVSAAKQVAIHGLDVDANHGGEALILSVNDGPIFVEESTFVGSGIPLFQSAHGARVSSTANATFVDCGFSVGFGSGGVAGLQIAQSSVHLYGCTMVGGDQPLDQLPGGDGCQIVGGFLFASDCAFFGGTGGKGTPPVLFQPCTDGAQGGHGLHLPIGSPTAKIVDCSFTGGAGGAPTDAACNVGPSGNGQQVPTGTLTEFDLPARTYDIPSPVREGTTGSITLASDPGEFVWLFFSVFQAPSYADTIRGTLLPGTPHIVIFLGALPGGSITFNVPVPVEPSTQSFALIEQAVYYTPAKGFQVSNPRLGVVLDQSL